MGAIGRAWFAFTGNVAVQWLGELVLALAVAGLGLWALFLAFPYLLLPDARLLASEAQTGLAMRILSWANYKASPNDPVGHLRVGLWGMSLIGMAVLAAGAYLVGRFWGRLSGVRQEDERRALRLGRRWLG